jgi:hypothetical protein
MILAISGEIGSGKDTVGKLIQIITEAPHFTDEAVLSFLERGVPMPKFENKKFADKLKDMVCLLLNCTKEQLEDREFKERELGEEWWLYVCTDGGAVYGSYLDNVFTEIKKNIRIEKLTPRKLMQLLGTECGRQIIHPDIWVNALMSEYKPKVTYQMEMLDLGASDLQREKIGKPFYDEYPKWIITDMRFPNEFKAVKDRNGIVIRVERWIEKELTLDEACDIYVKGDRHLFGIDDNGVEAEIKVAEDFNNFSRFALERTASTHESETALDNHKFDYLIDNNGSLSTLVVKVREILIKEKII